MASGTKLILAGLVVAATTAYMAYLGAAESWQYYLTADECLEKRQELTGKRLRVSGQVAAGTLQDDYPAQQVTFALAGTDGTLPVDFRGTVPDNLAEGIEVVAQGRLDAAGTLQADKLLTKCASKYASEQSAGPGSSPGRQAETATETQP